MGWKKAGDRCVSTWPEGTYHENYTITFMLLFLGAVISLSVKRGGGTGGKIEEKIKADVMGGEGNGFKRWKVNNLMKMERAEILARGRVQKVGYNDFVAEIANSLDIGGRAKNLPDGTVRIVAEAEKDVLERFIPLIQPKDDPMIKVTGVDVEFESATAEFEYFDVEYEDFNIEAFERIGTAATYLKRIDKKQDQMLGKQDQMLGKQDQTTGVLSNLDAHMTQRFDNLDVKYGKIAENMEKAIVAIDRTSDNTEKILEKSERDREDFQDTTKGILNAILKLAENSWLWPCFYI